MPRSVNDDVWAWLPAVPSIPKVRWPATGNAASNAPSHCRASAASVGGPASSRKLPHQNDGLSGVRTTTWSPRSSIVLPLISSSARSVRQPRPWMSMTGP